MSCIRNAASSGRWPGRGRCCSTAADGLGPPPPSRRCGSTIDLGQSTTHRPIWRVQTACGADRRSRRGRRYADGAGQVGAHRGADGTAGRGRARSGWRVSSTGCSVASRRQDDDGTRAPGSRRCCRRCRTDVTLNGLMPPRQHRSPWLLHAAGLHGRQSGLVVVTAPNPRAHPSGPEGGAGRRRPGRGDWRTRPPCRPRHGLYPGPRGADRRGGRRPRRRMPRGSSPLRRGARPGIDPPASAVTSMPFHIPRATAGNADIDGVVSAIIPALMAAIIVAAHSASASWVPVPARSQRPGSKLMTASIAALTSSGIHVMSPSWRQRQPWRPGPAVAGSQDRPGRPRSLRAVDEGAAEAMAATGRRMQRAHRPARCTPHLVGVGVRRSPRPCPRSA